VRWHRGGEERREDARGAAARSLERASTKRPYGSRLPARGASETSARARAGSARAALAPRRRCAPRRRPRPRRRRRPRQSRAGRGRSPRDTWGWAEEGAVGSGARGRSGKGDWHERAAGTGLRISRSRDGRTPGSMYAASPAAARASRARASRARARARGRLT
jgi:hypothetical protein